MKQARGMRNNNPLNIIKSEKINWQGEVKPSTDPNFAQFETLEYGLRAAFKLSRRCAGTQDSIPTSSCLR